MYDQHFKKVYGAGVEFIGAGKGDEPVAKVRTYISNRSVEEIAPEIAKSLREITEKIGMQKDADKLKKVSLALIDSFINYIRSKKDEKNR